MARRLEFGGGAATLVDLWSRCLAGHCRMVDGCLRACAASRSFAISPCYSSDAGALDLRRDRVDLAPIVGAGAHPCAVASQSKFLFSPGADFRATILRRLGCRSARGPGVQHVAGHRRLLHSILDSPVV